METIPEDGSPELKVSFLPELHLQRRIWVLNILRKESVTNVLDMGCGEGQLLVPLSQPAPWLTPPPASILPPNNPGTSSSSSTATTSPAYNDDEIPNLHISHLHGVDISKYDLEFAARETTPPNFSPDATHSFYHIQQRWEDLQVKLWQGGLEVINDEFVGIECIVSTEVIEHLPPEVFPAFAPMLLGVYHPQLLLITTPSYTYNARFVAPDAPNSARWGFPDPTRRTERVFRHDDHKFEWTVDEFRAWCEGAAEEWGYDVEMSGVGRAVEPDPWNREDELGEASLVACFKKALRKKDSERESCGREVVAKLSLPGKLHELFARHIHQPHASSREPKTLPEIAAAVIKKMDQFNEAFMRMEEVWFEPDVSSACGGWIEFLVRAIEESEDLNLLKEGDMGNNRSRWMIQRLGALTDTASPWPQEGESSLDYIPPEWEPEESEFEESVAADGDISWNNSELDTEDEGGVDWGKAYMHLRENKVLGWGSGDEVEEEAVSPYSPTTKKHNIISPTDPNAGWDGDASEETS